MSYPSSKRTNFLHIGKNLANVPYLYSKLLNERGIRVDLYIGRISDVTQQPLSKPKWLFYSNNSMERIKHLIKSWKEYEYYQTYAASSIFVQFFNKPYIIYATGSDLHVLPYENSLRAKLFLRSIENSEALLFSNTHLLEDVYKLKIKRHHFVPQPLLFNITPIKPKRFSHKLRRPIFFMPSRLDFQVKKNNIVLEAFKIYKRKGGKGSLILIEHGRDLAKSKKILRGVRDVLFLPPLNKENLFYFYKLSDLVIDQFSLGAFGLISLEAMYNSKPLLTYIRRDLFLKCYSTLPKIFNLNTVEDITSLFFSIEQKEWDLISIGKSLKEWIKAEHEEGKIFYKLKGIYKKYNFV